MGNGLWLPTMGCGRYAPHRLRVLAKAPPWWGQYIVDVGITIETVQPEPYRSTYLLTGCRNVPDVLPEWLERVLL